ncbi:MAG: tRNA glutamyl-Q(34) synthetase GluQRS [Deltaproteobacteria bacterium]|nr:tRNA glutamyl-Q(34) synthetase GluQRS [Deltaproteobacteria bacterium]
MYRGRYAPSPTGPLHLGNALAAAVAFRRARGGAFVLRVEDLDRPRCVPGMVERQLEDLRWLGITWSEGPFFQSERSYDAAIAALFAAGRAYYCTCSRKQIAAVSAPHGPADDGPRYPGTCRGRIEKPSGRYAVRFLVEPGVVRVDDALQGPFEQDVDASVGDFVIARADGVVAYQLAVVADDIAMQMTEVVRGGDLLYSTPRQIQLFEALGAAPPAFAHTPLVVAEKDGTKLSKRDGGHTLEGLRARGVDGPALRDRMAALGSEKRATIALDEII